MDVDENGRIDEIFKFMCEPILAPLQEVYFLIIPEKAFVPHPLDSEFAKRIDENSVFSRSRRKMLLDLVGYKPKNKRLVQYSLEEMMQLNNCNLATVQLNLDPYIQKGMPFSREVTFNFIRDEESPQKAQEANEKKRKSSKSAKKREGRLKRQKKLLAVEQSAATQSQSQLTV